MRSDEGGGHVSGFEEYVAARWAPLVRNVYMLGCAPAEAEDVVQDALFDVWRHWARVTKADDVDAYVFRVVLNKLKRTRRFARPAHVEALTDRDEFAVPDATTTSLLELDIRESLRRLPMDQRAVIVLRYLADQSEDSIARILGVPLGTVKSRTHRGLQKLEGHLTQQADRR